MLTALPTLPPQSETQLSQMAASADPEGEEAAGGEEGDVDAQQAQQAQQASNLAFQLLMEAAASPSRGLCGAADPAAAATLAGAVTAQLTPGKCRARLRWGALSLKRGNNYGRGAG